MWEWNEAIVTTSAERGLRGGSFSDGDSSLQSTNRYFCSSPSYENSMIGFRVSQVPEPSPIIALLGGLTGPIALIVRRKA